MIRHFILLTISQMMLIALLFGLPCSYAKNVTSGIAPSVDSLSCAENCDVDSAVSENATAIGVYDCLLTELFSDEESFKNDINNIKAEDFQNYLLISENDVSYARLIDNVIKPIATVSTDGYINMLSEATENSWFNKVLPNEVFKHVFCLNGRFGFYKDGMAVCYITDKDSYVYYDHFTGEYFMPVQCFIKAMQMESDIRKTLSAPGGPSSVFEDYDFSQYNLNSDKFDFSKPFPEAKDQTVLKQPSSENKETELDESEASGSINTDQIVKIVLYSVGACAVVSVLVLTFELAKVFKVRKNGNV